MKKNNFSDSINNEIYDYFIKDFYYKMITNYRKKIYKFDSKTTLEFLKSKRIKEIKIQKLRKVIFNDSLDENVLEDIRKKMKDVIEKSIPNVSADINLKIVNKNDMMFYYEIEFKQLSIYENIKEEIQSISLEELDVMEPYTIPEDILKFYIENPYKNKEGKNFEIKLNF